MNYNRKKWEKLHKKNEYAKELKEPKYRQRVVPSRREIKLKPVNLEKILNDE